MLKRVKLSSLQPNPWRHFETYKIVKDKVETLKESISATGFWEGQIMARPVKGGYQIAWGHHRWVAAKEALGEGAYIGIVVTELSDDDMLRRMARENSEIYDANAAMDIELVKATIEGYVDGRVNLPEIKTKSPLFSDNYIGSTRRAGRYFARDALIEYLGLKRWRVEEALGALRLLLAKEVQVDDYQSLSPAQAQQVSRAARAAKAATEDKGATRRVAKQVSKAIRETPPKTGKRTGARAGPARRTAAKAIARETGKDTEIVRFGKRIIATRNDINSARNKLNRLVEDMLEKNVTEVSGPQIVDLHKAIADMEEAISFYNSNFRKVPRLEVI